MIDKRPLRTNNFGSAHTSFVAPDDRLLGRMSLLAMQYRANFLVEEYKRPTFKVEVKVDSAQLGDSLYISGLAKSYAGVPVSQAKIVLRTSTSENVPYWVRGFDEWGSYNSIPNQTIQTTTGAEGKFQVSVPALQPPRQTGILLLTRFG